MKNKKYKRKTHKGLAKRVKVTASGKVKRKASFGGHLMSGKPSRRRRRVSGMITMKKSDTRRTKEALCV